MGESRTSLVPGERSSIDETPRASGIPPDEVDSIPVLPEGHQTGGGVVGSSHQSAPVAPPTGIEEIDSPTIYPSDPEVSQFDFGFGRPRQEYQRVTASNDGYGAFDPRVDRDMPRTPGSFYEDEPELQSRRTSIPRKPVPQRDAEAEEDLPTRRTKHERSTSRGLSWSPPGDQWRG